MRRLFDTQLLVWSLIAPRNLSAEAAQLLTDPEGIAIFSAASVWEVAIKTGLNKPDFAIDPDDFLRALLEAGFESLPVLPEHTLRISNLPPLHKDPFDRLLIAQAMAEDLVLVTADKTIARYPGKILRV